MLKKIITLLTSGIIAASLLTGCIQQEIPETPFTAREQEFTFVLEDIPGFELPENYKLKKSGKDQDVYYSQLSKPKNEMGLFICEYEKTDLTDEEKEAAKKNPEDTKSIMLRTTMSVYNDKSSASKVYNDFVTEYKKSGKVGNYSSLDNLRMKADKAFMFKLNDVKHNNVIIGLLKDKTYYEIYVINYTFDPYTVSGVLNEKAGKVNEYFTKIINADDKKAVKNGSSEASDESGASKESSDK